MKIFALAFHLLIDQIQKSYSTFVFLFHITIFLDTNICLFSCRMVGYIVHEEHMVCQDDIAW